ncbi:MAG TPA: ABC transporter ATP-binding protein [Steroidobacteraceae bacterium]
MSITLDQVTKRYQGQPVVNDVSLEIGDGEFFVLLGPSGSGKSTLLRAIAGLTGVDHGRIALHGRDVTHLSAQKRGVGLVFQNYALFRHMTVADNIEFALRVRRVKAAERRARRKELLRLVALEGMDNRLPSQLSGGQQQRVAVARALAHKPEVLLLDEPFGALDAKIREELRRTIRQVQRELGITTVLVTHDQEEAFALADRIGVMNLGRLLEVGKPDELYARPATRFVATFLGAANLLLARQTPDGLQFSAPQAAHNPGNPKGHAGEASLAIRQQEVVAVVRPEEIELAPTRDALSSPYLAAGSIEEMIFSGSLARLRVRLNGSSGVQLARADNGAAPVLEVTRTQHEQRAFQVTVGQAVAIGVRRVHVLPTPLSSFLVIGENDVEVENLRSAPLLNELATRMSTRVGARVEPALATHGACSEDHPGFVGTVVITPVTDLLSRLEWLFANGANDVLVLPPSAPSPQRVLIYWADECARRGTLAVSASLLRHVSAEGIYVGFLPEGTPESERPRSMRALLDARSEAHAHGLEMRTELRSGEVSDELVRQLNELPEQMLVLGVASAARLREDFSSLFAQPLRWPLLVVHRSSEKHA